MKKIVILFLLLITIFLIPLFTFAHPGRTASDGCHYCWTNCESWGYVYGTRHCHNGGSGGYTIPSIDYTFPKDMQAKWTFLPNDDGSTFNVVVELLDNNVTRYSAVMNKCAGCDPGPLVDFDSKILYFKSITPGTWYVNVKKETNHYWSTTAYWTVPVPAWYKPIPTIAPTQQKSTLDSNPLLGVAFIFIIAFVFIFGIAFCAAMVVKTIALILSWIASKFSR